jgi:membrane-bound inhibitor of C-type lysozyme
MVAAASASGARYVGGGWEWWTKGLTEGTLSPLEPGESIASAPGLVCTAG